MASNQLAQLQSALAALLMEPREMAAFRADPKSYAAKFGLIGKKAALLAGLPPEGAAYFASRRVIDRHNYLRSDLPRSVAAVEADAGLAASYFADRPYAKEDPRAEVRQFAAWAKAAARSGGLPAPLADLVRLEAAGFLLLQKPPVKPAPSVRLLLRHDPDGLLGDAPRSAAPGRFQVALVRTRDDVDVRKLRR